MITDTEVINSNFTELRIYPSFTEVRQQYNAPRNFRMYFSRDVYSNIAHGSLSIEGIPVESKQVIAKTNNLDNKTVFIRHYEKEEPKECRVIRAEDLLLQDVKTNRYFTGQLYNLEHVVIPEQEGTEIIYTLENEGKATLSYLIHGIKWSPQYYLNILTDDCQHTFQGFADITNQTKQEFKINRTELISGDAALKTQSNTKFGRRARNRSRSQSRSRSRSPAFSDSSLNINEEEEDQTFKRIRIQPTFDSLPELAGLYFYAIDQPFTFLPRSTFSLPFINAVIRLNKYVGLTLPFSTRQSECGKLKRKYRIESIDKFIPGGSVTIREQGRLVGSATLSDMAIGDKQVLICGEDPDVSVNRQLKLISKKRDSTVYEIHLKFKNVKSKPMKVEYREIIERHGAQFTIVPKGTDEQRSQIRTTVNGIQIQANDDIMDSYFILDANGGEQSFEFEVHFNYGNRNGQQGQKKRRN